jgi:hypothetical protein
MEQCNWVITDYKGSPVWATTCMNVHVFRKGSPKENGFAFCPFCGYKLAVFSTHHDNKVQVGLSPVEDYAEMPAVKPARMEEVNLSKQKLGEFKINEPS